MFRMTCSHVCECSPCEASNNHQTFYQNNIKHIVGYCLVQHYDCQKSISMLDWTWSWPIWIRNIQYSFKETTRKMCRTRQHPIGDIPKNNNERLKLFLLVWQQLHSIPNIWQHHRNRGMNFWQWLYDSFYMSITLRINPSFWGWVSLDTY